MRREPSHDDEHRSRRCAIYTRKSSEEGLDQAFNSLDAQREAGVDFIKSQKHQGWIGLKTTYDDGGYSGGTMERPGLRRLLADIEAHRVDVVVVYKVDRLSRSLADFARLMQLFDEHGVSFVSVTQQFNTTTSMGRLTLNMLLSFAQFEREVAGERIRDKIAATKRKGVWVTGQPPLGYRVPREGDSDYTEGDRTLRIVETEAKLVRAIFAGYMDHGSLLTLARDLNAAGHRTRKWTSSRGVTHGGKPLTAHYLYSVLTNPVYIGKIAHKRGTQAHDHASSNVIQVYPGLHEAIVDNATWEAVQMRMRTVARSDKAPNAVSHTHLLKGKLFTAQGSRMSPSSVQRPMTKRRDAAEPVPKRVVHYYVSQKAIKLGYAACPIKSVNAQHVDDLVRTLVVDHAARASEIDRACWDMGARNQIVRASVDRVTLALDVLTIELSGSRLADMVRGIASTPPHSHSKSSASFQSDSPGVASSVLPTVTTDGDKVLLTLKVNIKRHDGRRLLVNPDGGELVANITPSGKSTPHKHIRLAVGLAFAWREQLLSSGMPVAQLAKQVGVTEGRVHYLLNLTQLSPALIRQALTGELGTMVSLQALVQIAERMDWAQQRVA